MPTAFLVAKELEITQALVKEWTYEIVNRHNREILVFYRENDSAKGSITLDTEEEKAEWKSILMLLKLNIKS